MEALRRRGARVRVILPGLNINSFGYTEQQAREGLFGAVGVHWVGHLRDYLAAILSADAVVLGSWKQNKWMVAGARSLGKLTVEFDTSGGLDQWTFGSHALLVKGAFTERMAYRQQYSPLQSDTAVQVTGSLLFERPSGDYPLPDRGAFCARYDLDPGRPIAVFFPKAIRLFEQKLKAWFPEQGGAYHAWYTQRREAICRAVHRAGFNLLIKMHPAAYASYRTQSDQEYAFWRQFPWARVVAPDDTFACYTHLDVGIGIVTHSAMDLGYWRRPFIYVDSDLAPMTPFINADIARGGCALPPGPSLGWGAQSPDPHPYHFPSWVGAACRIDDLADMLVDRGYVENDPAHYDRFIAEFWHRADGLSAGRIADAVLSRLDGYRARIQPRRLAHVLRQAWRGRAQADESAGSGG